MKNKLYAVILAGGAGTRFWPLSRKTKPKQFLNIIGKNSLLQETILRIRTSIPTKNIFIVTSTLYKEDLRRQTVAFKIPHKNLLFEPDAKNTAPSIAWAAFRIYERDPKATIVVLPSDHLILHKRAFLLYLSRAVKLAAQGFLVTMGIVPTRPETGYGYLKTRKEKIGQESITRVIQFTEKPSRKKAEQFLKTKTYLWNSGMFIWKAAVIIEEFKKQQPVIYRLFKDGNRDVRIKKIWAKLPKISVDYAILEHAKRIATIPARNIGWSDLGSWESLYQALPKDKKKNVLQGDVLQIDSKNTFIHGNKRLIAAVGLKDIVIVDTPDSLLVCRKDFSQHVREVLEVLQKKKRKEL